MKTLQRATALSVALVGAITLSACGGDSPPAEPGTTDDQTTTTTDTPDSGTASGDLPFDPCDLLTVDEVNAYTGASVGLGERQAMDTAGAKDCWWLDENTFASVTIQAFARNSVDADAFNSSTEETGLTAEPISGFGDEAIIVLGFGMGGAGFASEGPDVVNSLWVHHNGNTIAVYAWGTQLGSAQYSEFEDLVRAALARMP